MILMEVQSIIMNPIMHQKQLNDANNRKSWTEQVVHSEKKTNTVIVNFKTLIALVTVQE